MHGTPKLDPHLGSPDARTELAQGSDMYKEIIIATSNMSAFGS